MFFFPTLANDISQPELLLNNISPPPIEQTYSSGVKTAFEFLQHRGARYRWGGELSSTVKKEMLGRVRDSVNPDVMDASYGQRSMRLSSRSRIGRNSIGVDCSGLSNKLIAAGMIAANHSLKQSNQLASTALTATDSPVRPFISQKYYFSNALIAQFLEGDQTAQGIFTWLRKNNFALTQGNYKTFLKNLPPTGSVIGTSRGRGRVTHVAVVAGGDVLESPGSNQKIRRTPLKEWLQGRKDSKFTVANILHGAMGSSASVVFKSSLGRQMAKVLQRKGFQLRYANAKLGKVDLPSKTITVSSGWGCETEGISTIICMARALLLESAAAASGRGKALEAAATLAITAEIARKTGDVSFLDRAFRHFRTPAPLRQTVRRGAAMKRVMQLIPSLGGQKGALTTEESALRQKVSRFANALAHAVMR